MCADRPRLRNNCVEAASIMLCLIRRRHASAQPRAVARADADVFRTFAKAEYREKVWDHAGGVILVEEAGGGVSDAGGVPLDFSKGRYLELDRGIVAASSALHEKLMQAIQMSWDSAAL